MSSVDMGREGDAAAAATMKLEVVVVPVSDVDRAKRFYATLGFREDIDYSSGDDFRVVQFTPPGSECSIIIGTGITSAAPGSVDALQLTVVDIEVARAGLAARGVEVSEAFHDAGGVFHHAGTEGRAPGPAPGRSDYGSFASFRDPDGNGWLLQEVRTRAPGRGLPRDVATLAALLREAEEHHGAYEATAPKHHWSGWYAAFIDARQQGRTADEASHGAADYMAGRLAAGEGGS